MFAKPSYFSALFFFYKLASAATFVIPADGSVVGEVQYINADVGETLGDVGIRYGIGYYEMTRANPQVDPVIPLPMRASILIPSRFKLPQGPHRGIVINLAEYRLYYFPENDNVVMTYPVGVGRKGWNTPLGVTTVIAKERDPVWRPTAKLQAEGAKHGQIVPEAFPGGSGNPLGRYVMRLGWPTYLIHGTNRTDSIGMRVSAGCVRMLPDDIEYLFNRVPVGTSVRIVNQPLK